MGCLSSCHAPPQPPTLRHFTSLEAPQVSPRAPCWGGLALLPDAATSASIVPFCDPLESGAVTPLEVAAPNPHSRAPRWGQKSSPAPPPSAPPFGSGGLPLPGPRLPRAVWSTRYLQRRSGSVRLRGAGVVQVFRLQEAAVQQLRRLLPVGEAGGAQAPDLVGGIVGEDVPAGLEHHDSRQALHGEAAPEVPVGRARQSGRKPVPDPELGSHPHPQDSRSAFRVHGVRWGRPGTWPGLSGLCTVSPIPQTSYHFIYFMSCHVMSYYNYICYNTSQHALCGTYLC